MPSFAEITAKLSRGAGRYVPTGRRTMNNSGPIVSFTFDDVPDSAYLAGAAILERHGVRGTFYIAPGILGTRDEFWSVITAEQTADLCRRGHEIGCHTHDHVKVQTLSTGGMEVDIARSRASLRAICGDIALRNFAYPFGVVAFERKLQLRRAFRSCRGIYLGVNAATVDTDLLVVQEIYDRTLDAARLAALLDETVARNGWLILYTHDVADPPSWIGCSPGLLDHAVAAVRARGIDCLTVDAALDRIVGAEATG